MTTQPTAPGDPAAVLARLIEPLLDSGSGPAGTRFDDLVAAAVADGTLSAELARELRYWQRASVHEVNDHVLTVLPAVLPVALEAVRSAHADAAEAVAAAEAAWHSRHLPTGVASDSSEPALNTEPPAADSPISGQTDHSPAPPPAEVVLSPENTMITGDSTSPDPVPAAAQDAQLRRRLFVAGLTSTA